MRFLAKHLFLVLLVTLVCSTFLRADDQSDQRALDLIGNANDSLLFQVVQESSAEITREFQLRENLSWVMYHEGQKEQIRTMLGRGNFEGIRSVYHNKQDHNPNARNLLAAVSNAYIRDLVNSLGGARRPAEVRPALCGDGRSRACHAR